MSARKQHWLTLDQVAPSGESYERAVPDDRLPARLDPYFVWAEGSGFASIGNRRPERARGTRRQREVLAPCVVEIAVGKLSLKAGATPWWRALSDETGLWVTTAFLDLPRGRDGQLLERHHFSALVPIDRFREVVAHPVVRRVLFSAPRGVWREDPRRPADTRQSMPRPLAGKPGKLVIAVIDDGCPFLHKQFRRDGGTRIACVWDQDVGHDRPSGPWKRVPNFGFGRELRRNEIEKALVDLDDEADRYRFLRYPAERDVARDAPPATALPMPRSTHGSSVMALAAGHPDPMSAAAFGQPADAAGEADLIFVQLPSETVRDTSGASLQTYLLDALRYTMDRTHPQAKLVVNISYGAAAGPHDGTSILEGAIEQMLAERDDFAILVPAGNLYADLSDNHPATVERRLHAVLHLEPQGSADLAWQLPFDGDNDHLLELWPRADDDKSIADLGVALCPPDADVADSVLVGRGRARFARIDDRKEPSAAVINQADAPQGCRSHGPPDHPLVLLAVAGAEAEPSRAAPGGRWTVLVHNRSKAALTVHAWIERSDATFGGNGRQSFFPADEPACSVAHTLGSLAHTGGVVVVGGVMRDSARVANYSSSGPALSPSTRRGPTISAPCEESDAVHGLIVPGCFSGDSVRANGTSVATPVAARQLAIALASGRAPLSRAAVETLVATLGTALTPSEREGDRLL